MISRFSHPLCLHIKFLLDRNRAPRYAVCRIFFFVLLASMLSVNCNSPFQPEVNYTPKLNVYSVLFANSNVVYVRVMSVVKSPSEVSNPVHGATVTLFGSDPKIPNQGITLTDTVGVINGDTASFYYAPVHVISGYSYSISVFKVGYPQAYAYAFVPNAYAAIPDPNTYFILRNPQKATTNINLTVSLSGLASAAFVQMFVEYRGIDNAGGLHAGMFNVFPVDSLNPFTELEGNMLPLTVDTGQYHAAYDLASQYAKTMKASHMYADIVVTQIDDNLYRYFITSTRTLDPLQMRTDKIIFSNIFNNAGTGIVAGASVDTTRIFLF